MKKVEGSMNDEWNAGGKAFAGGNRYKIGSKNTQPVN